jgi:hypothetical protein
MVGKVSFPSACFPQEEEGTAFFLLLPYLPGRILVFTTTLIIGSRFAKP